MSLTDRVLKRMLDLTLALLGLFIFGWLILLAFFVATIDTRQNGFFTQSRVGRYGRKFRIIKIRTMKSNDSITTSVTSSDDPRITAVGKIMRRTKIDELPQLINILLGTMSFVGPRPDVPGFADALTGRDRDILTMRPGITGPATLRFRDEEALLAAQADPEAYNREVIFPQKVRLNLEYLENYSLIKDIQILFDTVFKTSHSRK